MKVIIDKKGRLEIKPENTTEAYALNKWAESNMDKKTFDSITTIAKPVEQEKSILLKEFSKAGSNRNKHKIQLRMCDPRNVDWEAEIEQLNKPSPMCKPQSAQIDCRNEKCIFHDDAKCINPSPAITIIDKGCTCWSESCKIS